jgi:glycosyltransferase involved in cell wall biosynthesis
LKSRIDISVCVTFHREGVLALPTIASMQSAVELCQTNGYNVEVIAALDSADRSTKDIIDFKKHLFSRVIVGEFGGPAQARNELVQDSNSEYIAILDGDDVWSSNWLSSSMKISESNPGFGERIWHPEHVYFFYEEDFDHHSNTDTPSSLSKSHFVHYSSSTVEEFDPKCLAFANPWSSLAISSRSLLLANPFMENLPLTGSGIEDWGFNWNTVHQGIVHDVVPKTLHMVRVKRHNSENLKNSILGLLPLPPNNFALFD